MMASHAPKLSAACPSRPVSILRILLTLLAILSSLHLASADETSATGMRVCVCECKGAAKQCCCSLERVYVSCLYALLYAEATTDPEILESPQSQTLPIGSVARFTCRASHPLKWMIEVDGVFETYEEAFEQVGIRLGSNDSILLMDATEANNGTMVKCSVLVISENGRASDESEVATLLVFGEFKSNFFHFGCINTNTVNSLIQNI